jgi:hypothetical protein
LQLLARDVACSVSSFRVAATFGLAAKAGLLFLARNHTHLYSEKEVSRGKTVKCVFSTLPKEGKEWLLVSDASEQRPWLGNMMS